MAEYRKESVKFGMVPWQVIGALREKKITSGNMIVYTALATFASKYDGSAYPGQLKLTEMTGYTQEFVSRSVTALERAGLLTTRDERKSGHKNYYFLTHHPLEKKYKKNKKKKDTTYTEKVSIGEVANDDDEFNLMEEDRPF